MVQPLGWQTRGAISRMARINITKTFLPPIEEYQKYVQKIWQSDQLTNQGPLVKEFENKTKQYLGVKNFQFVSSGTIGLQVALKALDIVEGEIITTPFSYVATTSSILWERCIPVYVDIQPETYLIDPTKIEAAITSRTRAIMPVHVFGYPCDVEAIEAIAKKHKLKVIYDAAHAFGVEYSDKPLLSYGDISVCSFHATKLFHTIEGGCLVAKSQVVDAKVDLIKRFGHNGNDHYRLGINAKANEFEAAMGLCNLEYVDKIIDERKRLSGLYDHLLGKRKSLRPTAKVTRYNYPYYPILLKSEKSLEKVSSKLADQDIFPRRYFYPSLNTLPYLHSRQQCPVAEDIASRVLCLPFYVGLDDEVAEKICRTIELYDT